MLIALVAAACDRGQSSVAAADSSSARAMHSSAASRSAASQPSTNPTVKVLCPATGRWAPCSVEKRLKSAGQVARKIEGDAPARAGFSIKPIVYALGRDSRLELFIYRDAAAMAKDLAKMDTIRVAPAGGVAAWPMTPTLIRSGNLAAVLLTRDAREADRLSLALTAGAPQPAR